MRRWIVVALLIAGCDSKTPDKPQALGPAPTLPPLADLTLTRTIDSQEFDKLPAPDAPPELRWNLGTNVKHVLSLKQKITIKQSSVPVGITPVVLEGYTQAEGSFVVDGRGVDEPGKAYIRLAITRQELGGQVFPAEAIKQAEASICEYAIAPDSTLTRPRRISGQAPQLIEVVFGLPLKPLAPGEVAETVIDVPPTSNAAGYRGKASTRLLDWRRIGARECARLETKFDVEQVMPPAITTVKGAYRGRVISYFCPARGHFVQVEANMTLSQRSAVQKHPEKDPTGPLVWGIDSFDAESVLEARIKE